MHTYYTNTSAIYLFQMAKCRRNGLSTTMANVFTHRGVPIDVDT